MAVGGSDLNWERNPLAEGRPGVLCQGSEPKTRGLQAGCMWTWVLSGPCHLGNTVPSRVTGVVKGFEVKGFELGEDSFGRGPAWGMMPMI